MSIALNDYSSSPRLGDVYQRDLEVNYCTNFSCCGLTLGDLHALLQHYEESHVRFEEEDDNGHPVPAGFIDEDAWSSGTESHPNNNNSSSGSNNLHLHGRQINNHLKPTSAAAGAALTASQHQQQQQEQKLTPLSFLNAKRRTNGVSLSDIYLGDSGFPTTTDDTVSAFQNSILRTTAAQSELTSLASKKRDLAAYSTSIDTNTPMTKKTSNVQNMILSSAFNSQGMTTTSLSSASKTNSQDHHAKGASTTGATTTSSSSSSTSTSTSNTGKTQEDLLASITDYLQLAMKQGLLPDSSEVDSPSYLQAAEDLIRKREELVSMMESIGKPGSSSVDKPYRCQVSGCDKAYKNPNGLKYHNQHGHCSTAGLADSEGPESKPYVCSFMECGKRYKNLNGLKYHIEHSHPNLTAALRAHQAGLTNHPLL
ncbi:Transcriptional regulator of ribosomal biogenesis protein, partial [Modicella reniformis]